MADFIPVPDVGEFVVVQSYAGQQVINVFHIKKEGGWTSASLAAMAVVIISAYNDHFADWQTVDLQYQKVKCRDLTTEAGAIAEVDFPLNSGGDEAVLSAPAQVSISISHTTGVAGRSFRGRTSFSGVPAVAIDDNLLTQAYADAFVAAVDQFDADVIAAGGTWGVVSRYSGYTQSPPKYKKVPTPREEGIFTDIINNSCSRRVGSQDSRNN